MLLRLLTGKNQTTSDALLQKPTLLFNLRRGATTKNCEPFFAETTIGVQDTIMADIHHNLAFLPRVQPTPCRGPSTGKLSARACEH